LIAQEARRIRRDGGPKASAALAMPGKESAHGVSVAALDAMGHRRFTRRRRLPRAAVERSLLYGVVGYVRDGFGRNLPGLRALVDEAGEPRLGPSNASRGRIDRRARPRTARCLSTSMVETGQVRSMNGRLRRRCSLGADAAGCDDDDGSVCTGARSRSVAREAAAASSAAPAPCAPRRAPSSARTWTRVDRRTAASNRRRLAPGRRCARGRREPPELGQQVGRRDRSRFRRLRNRPAPAPDAARR
jgi:hypothetical protein